MNSKQLTRAAVVAAIYAVLTWILPVISYGPIQFRFSEILTLLAFYNPIYIISITIGAAISNLMSPLGIIDIFVGTFHSFISLYFISKSKSLFIASLYPALFSFIIGFEIILMSTESLSFFLITSQIMLSEFIIVTIIGVPVFKALSKNSKFREVMLDEDNLNHIANS
ncbi:MAG: QueT transporter family protein [Tissierellia bacterium]|nr:QueT transporter family protein [Tissierellia bacterium]